MTQAGESPSVWQRSRRLATQEIMDTAIRLFAAQGYEETTTAQIAQEAGVSQRTLFRYFGTKEDLVCGEQDELGERFLETVHTQPASVGIWDALQHGFASLFTDTTSHRALALVTLIFHTPALRARYTEKRLRWQSELLPIVVRRLTASGTTKDRADLEARAIIAVTFACADAAVGNWVALNGKTDLSDLYDQALALARTAPCEFAAGEA
ncbi:TetR/AcrR family transcriptional regulator [Streptomyces scopuliridis]|uniref:TetR/AcrR family transcriptional regulator n=1 Tax=Streptomyces scopuliridis TaxID=452529 RepID=UPI0036ACE0F7